MQEVRTDKADGGEDVKYRLYLEGEAQGVKVTVTRGQPFEGLWSGAQVSLSVSNPQTVLDTGDKEKEE